MYWLNNPIWHRHTTFMVRPVRVSIAYIFGRILAMEKCIRELCQGAKMDKSTSNPLFDVGEDVHLEIHDSPRDWYFPDKNDLNA